MQIGLRILFTIAMLWTGFCAQALVTDTASVQFGQGRVTPLDGGAHLQTIAERIQSRATDSLLRLQGITIIGAASPEGSIGINRRLSERRALFVQDFLQEHAEVPDSLMSYSYVGRDWQGLLELVRTDCAVPFYDETVALIEEIIANGGEPFDGLDALTWLKQLRGGKPYKYLYDNIFPILRATRLHLYYASMLRKLERGVLAVPTITTGDVTSVPLGISPVDIYKAAPTPTSSLYLGLKTNMLYDIALLPNICAELYVGSNLSVTANWMYGWWNCDSRHHYWRAYGGDVGVRYWLSHGKPLTGHHIGVYGQMLTYDFEWGGKGYMGGVPGGSLWDKAHWGAGIEYGFALPIARRLNIDFTIGLGYLGGEYREYIPIDNCYVWQATKYRHWWGPTKVEISLVWLLGSGNHNKPKGGER